MEAFLYLQGIDYFHSDNNNNYNNKYVSEQTLI